MVRPEIKKRGNPLQTQENAKSAGCHNRFFLGVGVFPRIIQKEKVFSPDILKQKYLDQHLSCQKIADEIGNITRQGVWKALRRNGIKTRSKEDAIFHDNGQRCKIFLGYVWIYFPDHPRPYHKYVKRSTLSLEKKLGRYLLPGEFAHHVDENRLNDDPSNLELTDRSEHFSTHFLILPAKERSLDHKKIAKKLCGNDVLEIRSLRKNGLKMQDIANSFHVGRTAVHDVVCGKTWSYIK